MPPPVSPPPPPPIQSTMAQQRPHIRISPDTYHRPLLSMPPVILMGGGGGGGGVGNGIMSQSVPPSPIVEMPPSPAPNQMMFIEYPEDDVHEEVRSVF